MLMVRAISFSLDINGRDVLCSLLYDEMTSLIQIVGLALLTLKPHPKIGKQDFT